MLYRRQTVSGRDHRREGAPSSLALGAGQKGHLVEVRHLVGILRHPKRRAKRMARQVAYQRRRAGSRCLRRRVASMMNFHFPVFERKGRPAIVGDCRPSRGSISPYLPRSTRKREPSGERTRTRTPLSSELFFTAVLNSSTSFTAICPTRVMTIDGLNPAISAGLPGFTSVITTPLASPRPSCRATSSV